jgi:hypothetical protein
MNPKTTGVLIVLVVAAGLGLAVSFLLPAGAGQPPDILDPDIKAALTAEKAQQPARIVLEANGRRVELDRRPGKTEWTMPGNWPTRPDEVQRLTKLLAGLESRFVPAALTDQTKKDDGLVKPAVKVTLEAGDKKQVLEFGNPAATHEEVSGQANAFYQPTFLRLDGKDEVIRLAPGLVDSLRRPAEYYLQRWLFLPPQQHIQAGATAGKTGPAEVIRSIAFADRNDPKKNFTLAWSGSEWDLSQPVRDRVDPDRLKGILAAVPEVWAERFIEKSKKGPDEYGLKNPEQTLTVTKSNGRKTTVLVGKQFWGEPRRVTPPAPPFGGGRPPMPQIIREEYRYARLQDNPKVFGIRAEPLKDLDVAQSTLRDPRLARFRTDDARRVEITWHKDKIVLAKEKGTWKLLEPAPHDADTSKVTDLLDKLSGLEARGDDIHDHADPKTYGLAKPAGTIRVTVEEESKAKADAKTATKKTKKFEFILGKRDTDKSKLYVRVGGWERVNAVELSLYDLAKRPALAYRNRQVLSFSTADLARIDVRQPGDPFTLEQKDSKWRLTSPVKAEADSVKTDQLAGDLGFLEAVEFIAPSAASGDLEKRYGLGKSALSAKVTFTDAKKKPQVLTVGKQRPGKQEYFAKLESSPAVFVVKKDLHDALEKSSLTYRPAQLWDVRAEDIGELGVGEKGQAYDLKRTGKNWRIAGPFDAAAVSGSVQPMIDELATPRCERYEAHTADAKALEKYGLNKPYLRVTVTVTPKKDDKKPENPKNKAKKKKEEKPKTTQHTLLVGKPTKPKSKERFAKLGAGAAVFVLGEKTVAALDHGALDLLDRNLLTLDVKTIQKVQSTGGTKGPLALERKGEDWRVAASPAGAFPADREVVDSLLGTWADLRADRFAAYGPKADLAAYGLKGPSATVKVSLTPADKKAKGKEHTLVLGKPVPGTKGERYARLDQGPGVVVLDAETVRRLTRTYLDFVNRSPWTFDAAAVTHVERREGQHTLELAKHDRDWQIVKPAKHPADRATLDLLVRRLADLRAKGVAAFPAKDLKPFGLDKPTAVITLRLTGADKKPAKHVLRIGKADKSGEHFAVADKSGAVYLLSGSLVEDLTAGPLHFRDRNLPGLVGDTDRVTVDRDGRKAVFTKTDGTWKMTAPVEAEAEQALLEDFLKGLAKLRADELVAEKPADLKPFGLNRPQATWRFLAGDKQLLALQVGAHEKIKGKPGPRCYAQLSGSNVVFLLDPAMTSQVLGEYRSRKVWDGPDAAQVEELRYGYPDRPFTLKKTGTDWHVADKPDLKVKADAVRDALDALAGLKAERYVDDKGTALKLYGLQPPQLVLEVKTPTGPAKTLHVGRRVGNTKSYYAQVSGGDYSAVFVLEEKDAGRIVRSLKEFTPPRP